MQSRRILIGKVFSITAREPPAPSSDFFGIMEGFRDRVIPHL